jgi:hypothetical protein
MEAPAFELGDKELAGPQEIEKLLQVYVDERRIKLRHIYNLEDYVFIRDQLRYGE